MDTMTLILKRLRDLPIVNSDAYRLVDYVSRPEPSFKVLEDMLKNNSRLCSQIMRLANSAINQRIQAAETLGDAIVALGFATLKQVFMQNFYASVSILMGTQKKMLDHGQQCAVLSEFVARGAALGAADIQKARLGGLLHDIGQQFLAYMFPGPFAQVGMKLARGTATVCNLEREAFGVDHQQVGALLGEKWNFPDYLIGIIANHHSLKDKKHELYTLPVNIANGILHKIERTTGEPYDSALKTLFTGRGKPLPWGDPVAAARNALCS